MKTILFFPSAKADENFYLEKLTTTVSNKFNICGVQESLNLKECKNLINYDFCHLNWFENIKGKTYFRCLFEFVFRLIFLLFLVFQRKPIIWTIHNKVPHNHGRGNFFSKKMMKLLMKFSKRIHILTKSTMDEIPDLKKFQKKIRLIPHGDYINAFGENSIDIKKKYNIPKEKYIMFFSGKIGPYKNIDLLINAFKGANLTQSNIVLLICGDCKDSNYKLYLENLAKNTDNIVTDFSFISNAQMGDYLNQSTLLITPYDKTSALNSGTLWMAFSYKKTMICSMIGSIKDVANPNDLAFVYDYDSNENHEQILCKILKDLPDNIQNGLVEKKSKAAYDYMSQQTWKINTSQWESLYDF